MTPHTQLPQQTWTTIIPGCQTIKSRLAASACGTGNAAAVSKPAGSLGHAASRAQGKRMAVSWINQVAPGMLLDDPMTTETWC